MKYTSWYSLLFVAIVSACGSSPPPVAQNDAIVAQNDANLPSASVESHTDRDAPSMPQGVIVRPTFETAAGNFSAGTAFFVSIPGYSTPIGLTAHHLFGPAGGLQKEASAKELGEFVRGAYYSEIDSGGDKPHEAGPIIVLPSAGHSKNAEDRSTDVAAFRAPESLASRALRLAPRNAKRGDDVWLVAEVLGGKSTSARLHRAHVVASKPTILAYQFEDTKLELRATSGAPVVNARGELVGVNLVGGLQDGVLWGFANPVESVSARLMEGLADGVTCEAALAAYIAGWKRSSTSPPELNAGLYGALLNNGTYLKRCAVPDSMMVKVCIAIQEGHALGVTVTTNPPDLTIASCIREQVSALPFPVHARLDVSRTTFE